MPHEIPQIPNLPQKSEEQENFEFNKNLRIKIEQLKTIPLVKEAFNLLDGLSKNLKYHNKAHTEEVLGEALYLGMKDGLSDEDLHTLAIAASWHDVGFLVKAKDNEADGVRIMKEQIADMGDVDLTERELAIVEQMILDTNLKTIDGVPTIQITEGESKRLAGYLLDADVANFGREDFFKKGELIAEEIGVDLNNPQEKLGFYRYDVKLLENHKWHTDVARNSKESQKLKNLQILREEISQLEKQAA